MLAKLRLVCKKCSDESIKVYFRNIKRLYKLISDGDVPDSAAWLKKDELINKYKKLTLPQRRHLSISAVKIAQAYKNEALADKWSVFMYKDSAEYNQKRSLNKITDDEKKRWPTGGYPRLKKASTEFKRRIAKVFRTEPSLKNLYQYTRYIILRFYSEVAMRNDLASIMLKKGDGNYLTRSKGKYTIHMKQFKTAKSMGDTEITLGKGISKALYDYIKYRNSVDGIDHDYVLSNQKGKHLTKAAMGKILTKLTSDLLDKKIGSRIIRVLKATTYKDQIDAANKLATEMMHSSKTQKEYTRK